MSSQTRSYQQSDDLPQQVGGPPVLSMPDDWTLSTAWQCAQEETDRGGPHQRRRAYRRPQRR